MRTIVTFLIGFLVFLKAIVVDLGKVLVKIVKSLGQVLWILTKIITKLFLWFLYYSTRLITLPFRKCFPPHSLENMSGIDFEHFVTKWLAQEGYRNIKLTSSTADYGVDITALKDGTSIGVQCKRYSGKVGVAAIQEITAGINYYEADKGIVVTNSTFTQNAIDLAASNGIELIDGDNLKASRAAKNILRSSFSILLSSIFMGILLMITLLLNIWVIINAQSYFPLALMLFCICLLSLVNGIYELKERKKSPQTNNNESDESSDDLLTVPFDVD